MIALLANGLRRKVGSPGQIDGEAEYHTDTGGDEAQMPINPLTQRTADERRSAYSKLDAEKVGREAIGAAFIVNPIERPDLACDISLEAADTGQQQQQRD